MPLPRDVDPSLPMCIRRDINILSHDAIKLKTMAQFRVEFDRNVDKSVTLPGMLMAIQSHLDAMPDCGHGPPLGSALTNIKWHPELDRMQLQHATMVFTLDNESRGGPACIASLLCSPMQ